MDSLIVDIYLPRDTYLQIYSSYIRQVKAVARNGKSVRFPVNILKPFVTEAGVAGTFQLKFDDEHKFNGIERLA